MGLSLGRPLKTAGKPTQRYEVTYPNGMKRVKMLTADHAKQIGEGEGVKVRKLENASRTNARANTARHGA